MSVLTPGSPSSTPPGPELWPTHGPLVCDWIEESLVHGEGDSYGEPFRLRPDQVLIIYRWYEYEADEDGNFVRWHYDELLLECATGYGKTELGAAIALAELAGPTAPVAPNIPVSAASYEQADLLFGRAKQIAEHHKCLLRPFIEAYDTEILLVGRPGRMYRIAAVAGTNEGGIPTLFLADEIHEWTGRKERVHLVVRKSLRKRKGARTINMTTPGHNRKTLAGRVHDTGVEGHDPRLLHVWFSADVTLDLRDESQLRRAIREANFWKDDEAIDSLVADFAKMPEHEFRRYHLAQWVDVPDTGWLSDKPGAWEACEGPATFGEGRTAMAIDMSLNRDSTAVAEAHARSGDGRVPVRVRVFAPEASAGRVDYLEVKDYIRGRARALAPAAIVYDPRYLEVMARELADEGLPMVEMPQSPERMSPACGLAYDLILSGTLEHEDDPVLEAHVKAAHKRETDRGWSLSKGRSTTAIDGCIAMVMAVWEASQSEADAATEVYSW